MGFANPILDLVVARFASTRLCDSIPSFELHCFQFENDKNALRYDYFGLGRFPFRSDGFGGVLPFGLVGEEPFDPFVDSFLPNQPGKSSANVSGGFVIFSFGLSLLLEALRC